MPSHSIARCLLPALALLVVPVLQAGGGGQAPAVPPAPTRDYPIKPVPFTAVHLNDEFWAPRIEINRTASIPSAFEQCELTGRVNLFERAAAVLRGEANVDKRPARLSVRRNRSLQGDRRRVVFAERHARSEARCLRRRPDREDRRRAGARRLHLHDAHDRSEEPASLGRPRALGVRARRQPRALRPRPPVRGRGRAPPRHRQAHAARRRHQGRRSAGRAPSGPASARSGRAIRSPRWRW